MTPSRTMRCLLGGLLAVLLAAATAVTSALPAAAAADDPVVVVRTDFEDGSISPWTQSGGPALSVVDTETGKALLVSNRVNDFDGVQSPTGLLEPGVEYTFSLRARLAEGTPGAAGVRFVVKPDYTWVGDTTMTADAWTTVSGTFTAPAGADPAALQVYVGTGNLDGAGQYDYLVDDIMITAPGSPEPTEETVVSESFEDRDFSPWTQSGNPTLEYVDVDGGTALSITRNADYEGIQSPVGILRADRQYTLSMRARLPDGATGSTQVRFVVKPDYTWVGDTTIDGSGWTTVTGTYSVPAGTDPAGDAGLHRQRGRRPGRAVHDPRRRRPHHRSLRRRGAVAARSRPRRRSGRSGEPHRDAARPGPRHRRRRRPDLRRRTQPR